MERPSWAAASEVDLERPSAARIYDFLLGGAHNFAVDRAFGEQAMAVVPDFRLITQANRAFLRRAVRYLVDQGIRQFLDLGSGIPTVGNVHEIAQRARPDSRVLYVDCDPVAVAHSKAIIGADPRTAVLQADLRNPEEILTSALLHSWLNLDEPIGVLMVAVLHFVPDDEPAGIVARFRDAIAPGSHLVISHATATGDAEMGEQIENLYTRSTTSLHLRDEQQVTDLFTGLDLVEPGVVFLPEWRPEPDTVGIAADRSFMYAGVGRRG